MRIRSFRSQLSENDDHEVWRSMPGDHLHAETHASLTKAGYWRDGDEHVLEEVDHLEDPDHASDWLHDNVLKEHGWRRIPPADTHTHQRETEDDDMAPMTHYHEWDHPNGSKLTHIIRCAGSIPMESAVLMRIKK